MSIWCRTLAVVIIHDSCKQSVLLGLVRIPIRANNTDWFWYKNVYSVLSSIHQSGMFDNTERVKGLPCAYFFIRTILNASSETRLCPEDNDLLHSTKYRTLLIYTRIYELYTLLSRVLFCWVYIVINVLSLNIYPHSSGFASRWLGESFT